MNNRSKKAWENIAFSIDTDEFIREENPDGSEDAETADDHCIACIFAVPVKPIETFAGDIADIFNLEFKDYGFATVYFGDDDNVRENSWIEIFDHDPTDEMIAKFKDYVHTNHIPCHLCQCDPESRRQQDCLLLEIRAQDLPDFRNNKTNDDRNVLS